MRDSALTNLEWDDDHVKMDGINANLLLRSNFDRAGSLDEEEDSPVTVLLGGVLVNSGSIFSEWLPTAYPKVSEAKVEEVCWPLNGFEEDVVRQQMILAYVGFDGDKPTEADDNGFHAAIDHREIGQKKQAIHLARLERKIPKMRFDPSVDDLLDE